jgi:hypothetical protein
MFAGRMMPCQWMEVSCFRRLRTRNVTVSPSRQRRIGPGSEPLMVMAVRAAPVMFTGVSPMNRSNSLPVSTFGWPGLVTAQTGVRHRPSPPIIR